MPSQQSRLLIDLDCTLVFPKWAPPYVDIEGFVRVKSVPAIYDALREPYLLNVAVRPSTHAFLDGAAELGELEIVTYGPYDIQSKILEAVGLCRRFKNVWARDRHESIRQPALPFVLLDDHPLGGVNTEDWLVQDKLSWMGIDFDPETWHLYEDHFVQCARWQAGCDPEPLTMHLPEIAAKLERQHRRRSA